MRRLLIVILGLLASLSQANVPLVKDRSAMHQGLWWSSGRSGEGVELYQFGQDMFLVWYTCRSDRSPIWYTAQGKLDALSGFAGPLQMHRMESGRRLSQDVGTASVTLTASERARFAWSFNASTGLAAGSGVMDLLPFRAAGVMPEFDHSGLWWRPDLSGFGVGISETSSYQSLAIYAYDTNGQPIWMFGSRSSAVGPIELNLMNGSCPSCPRGSTEVKQRVTANLRFTAANRAEISIASGSPFASVYGGEHSLQNYSSTAAQRPADRSLARVSDGADLHRQLARAFFSDPAVTSGQGCMMDFSGSPGFTPVSLYSPTNLQELGVDESGFVKTDGEFVYALNPRSRALRIARVHQRSLQVFEGLNLSENSGLIDMRTAGLYLTDSDLIAVSGSTARMSSACGVISPFASSLFFQGGLTAIEIFDRRDRSRPSSRFVASIYGHLLESRRIDNALFVVTRTFVPRPANVPRIQQVDDLANTVRSIAELSPDKILPMIKLGRDPGPAVPLVRPDQIFVPPTGYDFGISDYITVTRFPLDKPSQFESVSVLGRALDLYMSEDHLFLMTSRLRAYSPVAGTGAASAYSTEIHQFAHTGPGFRYIGTGAAEGAVPGRNGARGTWRYHEKQGRFRIITANTDSWAPARNRLTILEPSQASPGFLRTLSVLPNAARPQTLGKPNEDLYGTRFVGDQLYAVTFRRVDPLYVVDLSNPTDPKIMGELEIPGFSDYLHPISPGVLLGVGLSAADAGSAWGDGGQAAWFQGLQLNLFDVSDPRNPRSLQRIELGRRGTSTEVFNHHHAFSILNDGSSLEMAIPAGIHDQPSPPLQPWSPVPFKEAGLLRYVISGEGSSTRMMALPSIVTQRADGVRTGAVNMLGARSVLFRDSVLYFEDGKFYFLARDGSATAGPL